jgi:hypothetical protein
MPKQVTFAGWQWATSLGFGTSLRHPKSKKNKLPLQDGNGQLKLELLSNQTDSSKAVTG